MSILSEQQVARAKEALQQLLQAPAGPEGKTPLADSRDRDKERIRLIGEELGPLVSAYLAGDVPLAEFKSKADGINKRNELWGFKGIKGQMFFNMLVNASEDADECDQETKAAITVPANDSMASSRIKTFLGYVKRVGEQWVDAGNTKHGRPKPGSILFFLSYFWQLQNKDIWPVYYTNSVNTMVDINLWQPSGDLAADYLSFKAIHEELAKLFTQDSGETFNLYDVEHVFWYLGGDPYGGSGGDDEEAPASLPGGTAPALVEGRLPESYVPPIVAVLLRMAEGDEEIAEAAKRSGTTIERAFEKNVNAAFTILGYETKLLGQGQGRVPDGVAVCTDESYAILWDAKVRSNAYSMGTDDRTIREYITTQSRDLKRRGRFRNIYYLIVSSRFTDDYDDAISGIKMDTDVNEVSLVEADALVAMVETKLRAPLQVTLGPDGLQRVFAHSRVLTADAVRELLV